MKILKKLLICTLLGIFIEISLLGYIDKFILDKDINIKITKFDEDSIANKNKNNFKLSKLANNIKISYDGNYICYKEQDTFHIVNVTSRGVKEIPFYNKNKIINYEWVKDRERIIMLEEDENKRIKLSYYDVQKNIKEDIVHLTWIQHKCTESQISISSMVNIIYVKIQDGEKSKIYSIDLMKSIKEVKLGETDIGNIAVMEKSNILIYEDLDKHFIMYNVQNKCGKILPMQYYKICNIDKNNNIYFYIMKEQKVYDIVYINDIKGKPLKKLSLNKGCDIENLFINSNGEIYCNKNDNCSVQNLINKKEFKYYGDFVGFYNEGFIYKDKQEILKKINFKDK